MNLCENSRVQLSKQHCATLSGKNLERRHVTSLRGRSQVCQTPWWHHPTPDTWRRMVDGPRASAAGDPGRQDSVGRRVVVGGVWKPCLGRLIQQCQPCLSLTGVVLSTLAHLIQFALVSDYLWVRTPLATMRTKVRFAIQAGLGIIANLKLTAGAFLHRLSTQRSGRNVYWINFHAT